MKHYITKVWIESGHVYAQTSDGLVASYAVSLWKRLASATEQQLNDFTFLIQGFATSILAGRTGHRMLFYRYKFTSHVAQH